MSGFPEREIDEYDIIKKNFSSILIKSEKITEKVKYIKSELKMNSFGMYFNPMIGSINEMVAIFSQNLSYFQNYKVYKDDIFNTFNVICTAFDSFHKSFNSILNPKKSKLLISQIQTDINTLSQFILVFASIFKEIIFKMNNSKELGYLNLRLGIEAALFNFSIDIKPISKYPFYKAKFYEVYKFYNTINKTSNSMHVFKSFYGTGKTVCVPLILINRILKDELNSPFCIVVQPSTKQIKSTEKILNNLISKYVKIITNSKELIELISSPSKEKLILALLTPESLLDLIHLFENDTNFFSMSHFIIDDFNIRTFSMDVLITKIAYLNHVKKVFSSPLNVVLLASFIDNSILSPFHGTVEVASLMGHSRYEIDDYVEKDETKIEETTVRVIEEMTNINSKIEEGNILCFCSDFDTCNKVKNSIILSLANKDKNEERRRRVVLLQTSLKQNEKTENFLSRLRDEYLSYEDNNDNYIYFVPLLFSYTNHELFEYSFPDDLQKINKLIFTTQIGESVDFDSLSVVIDNCLETEEIFNCFTTLTSKKEVQASKETMNKRRGKLGRNFKGLYIHKNNNKAFEKSTPEFERLDLTENILKMKRIGIDIEKMKNLPSKPKKQNVRFALDNWKYIGALDEKSLKITKFGIEILKFSFIPVYYAAAVINYKDSFPQKEQKDAYFISSYISILISMEESLIQEEMSESLLKNFCVDSDIVTLISTLNVLLSNDETDIKEIVESSGFSYSAFLTLKSHLQKIVDKTFPNKKVNEIISDMNSFVKNHEGISNIIDQFIYQIELVYPNWSEIHYIRFSHINENESHSTLVFRGSKYLDKQQRYAEVRISNRPGWKGIMTPVECYCFNITHKEKFGLNEGRLIHRITPYSKSGITSIELNKIALNPWFKVLFETYFESDNLNVTSLHVSKGNNLKYEERKFHFSNNGENLFVSFISRDCYVKDKIMNGANICLKLMPFTPRSVLIYHNETRVLVEIKSVGTEQYQCIYSNLYHGDRIDRKKIDYCIKHLDELKKINSSIRICAFFVNEKCQVSDLDQNNLYFINSKYQKLKQINESVIKRIKLFNDESLKEKLSQNYVLKNTANERLSYFQFPIDFIHPALICYQESQNCIMKWFNENCDYANVIKIVGHRFLMKMSEINELQEHLRFEKDRIIDQMNLHYTIIPVSDKIYSKSFLKIREHSKWFYDSKFKCIITTKDEENEVNELIEKVKIENEQITNVDSYLSSKALCCCYICDDPENPILTKLPITVYNEDGTTFTNRMCRNCIISSLQNTTEPFFVDGKIDIDSLGRIYSKPQGIPSIPCRENKNGTECWPQIPLGQMISALIQNDVEMSSLLSSWLQLVSEYAVRTQMRHVVTFCPDHPNHLYDVTSVKGKGFICGINGCQNTYCVLCQKWHPKNYQCNLYKNQTMCPKCKVVVYKDGGCNHMCCPCGYHWCFICGAGFNTASDCYSHLTQKHGGYWS